MAYKFSLDNISTIVKMMVSDVYSKRGLLCLEARAKKFLKIKIKMYISGNLVPVILTLEQISLKIENLKNVLNFYEGERL